MKTQWPITLRRERKTRTQLDVKETCISGVLPHLQLIESVDSVAGSPLRRLL